MDSEVPHDILLHLNPPSKLWIFRHYFQPQPWQHYLRRISIILLWGSGSNWNHKAVNAKITERKSPRAFPAICMQVRTVAEGRMAYLHICSSAQVATWQPHSSAPRRRPFHLLPGPHRAALPISPCCQAIAHRSEESENKGTSQGPAILYKLYHSIPPLPYTMSKRL